MPSINITLTSLQHHKVRESSPVNIKVLKLLIYPCLQSQSLVAVRYHIPITRALLSQPCFSSLPCIAKEPWVLRGKLNSTSTQWLQMHFPHFWPIPYFFWYFPGRLFLGGICRVEQGFPSSSSSLANSPSGIHVTAFAMWDLEEKCHITSSNHGTMTHKQMTSRLFLFFPEMWRKAYV